MILEFIGLPGSGKSTIFEAAKPKLDSAGMAWNTLRRVSARAIEEQRPKIGFLRRRDHRASLYGAVAYARDAPDLFDLLVGGLQDDLATTLWNMEMLSQLYFAERQSLDDTLVFIDEGFAHRGAATVLLNGNEDGFRDYMNKVPLHHVILHVTTPLSLCYMRMHSRKVKKRVPAGWAGETEEETLGTIARFDRLARLGCKLLRRRGATVIDIDGSLPVAETSDFLVSEAMKLSGQTPLSHDEPLTARASA